jgi:ferrous-iron efflux pump FieF
MGPSSPPVLHKQSLLMRSLGIAGFLMAVKLVAGLLTSSVAILASAADSLFDFMASLANLMLVRSASKPPDKDHPYGHGKIESLGGLLQGILMGFVALGVGGAAVFRLVHHLPLSQPDIGIAVILAAIFLNAWHVRGLRVSVRDSGSPVMAMEVLHYASDLITHVGALVSLVIFALTKSSFWDPVISLGIVAYLLVSIGRMFHDVFQELIDKQLPEPVVREIAGLIKSHHPKVVDFHAMRTRQAGDTKFIEFHVVLRGVKEFAEAHRLTESLTAELNRRYPGAIITVHTHPEEAPMHEE